MNEWLKWATYVAIWLHYMSMEAHIYRLDDGLPICVMPSDNHHFVVVDPEIGAKPPCELCGVVIRTWNSMP